MGSKIEWTDETWNPVVGCTKVSPGCDNCYAERMANRVRGMMYVLSSDKSMETWAKYNEVLTLGGKWNGKIFCDKKALNIPLHWRKPRQIFVCSMSDLFNAPFEFIYRVFEIIYKCPQHTFQILTKRIGRFAEQFTSKQPLRKREYFLPGLLSLNEIPWPLPNLWLGVTAENQEWWDKRKEAFFSIPAAVHFVSNEPCLGEIRYTDEDLKRLDQIIVGGESGPGARYCPVENIRSVVKQCKDAGVPVFVKQIHMWQTFDGRYWENEEWAEINRYNCKYKRVLVKDIKRFPEDLRVRDYPESSD